MFGIRTIERKFFEMNDYTGRSKSKMWISFRSTAFYDGDNTWRVKGLLFVPFIPKS
jgi:hypothetical protein